MTNQSPEMLEVLAARIKEVVDRTEDASDSEDSIGEAQTNRFNKLKRKSRYVSRGRLNVVGGILTDTVHTVYGAKKRATITSRRRGDSSSSDEEDAYHEVAIEEILAPISDPAEIVSHPAHRITFRRQALPTLANHAQLTISTEHEHRVQLSRLLTAFLGDDASLVMERYEETIKGSSLQTPLRQVALNSVSDDGAIPVKAMTRNQAAAEESFALAGEFLTPSYDRNLGLPPEEAEEARRFLQAALDRSEEYLRCMQKVRAGLVKADRYRKRTWRWAKDALEVNGEKD